MILQALNQYYKRLVQDESVNIPLYGFGKQKIHFALVIDKNGKLLQTQDLRGDAKYKELIVPKEVKRTGTKIAANFMWDNTGYVLGVDSKGNKKRSLKYFEEFKKYHKKIGKDLNNPAMKAILLFLDNWNPDNAEHLELWEELSGQNVVFRLDSELQYIHQQPEIKKVWENHYQANLSEIQAPCLVTGQTEPIARIHPDIKGVRGTQAKGAAIVSFNLDSFLSYGKKQNFNAPIGENAAFAYTTTLNHLLSYNSRQKIQIGDTTTIFWTERESIIEYFMQDFMNPPAPDQDDDIDSTAAHDKSKINDIRLFLEAARDGKMPMEIEQDSKVNFYILGLSPNASRISVRFWHVDRVEQIFRKIGTHFKDLSIIRQFDTDQEFPPMWQLLKETALQRKNNNISPLLAGALVRAILKEENYPVTMLSAIINRIKADQKINYLRASIIKAYLVRKYRKSNKPLEVTMGLDQNSENTAYVLGRLFAVLEKIQEEAQEGKLNKTIKDTFYGSASASPRSVFPRLLKLKNHHVSKLKRNNPGRATNFEKDITEIIDKLDVENNFPASLELEEQGLFSIGYYHQRKELFTKKDKTAKAKKEENNE